MGDKREIPSETTCAAKGAAATPFPTPEILAMQFYLGYRYNSRNKESIVLQDPKCKCLWCSLADIFESVISTDPSTHQELIGRLAIHNPDRIVSSMVSTPITNEKCVDITMDAMIRLVLHAIHMIDKPTKTTITTTTITTTATATTGNESDTDGEFPEEDVSTLQSRNALYRIYDMWVGFVCDVARLIGYHQSKCGTRDQAEEKLIVSLIAYQSARHSIHSANHKEMQLAMACDRCILRFILSCGSKQVSRICEIITKWCTNSRCVVSFVNGIADGIANGSETEKVCIATLTTMIPRISTAIIDTQNPREVIDLISALASIATACGHGSLIDNHGLLCAISCYSCIRLASAACEIRGWATACLSTCWSASEQKRVDDDLVVVKACCSAICWCCNLMTSLGTEGIPLEGQCGLVDIIAVSKDAATSALAAILDRSAIQRYKDCSISNSCGSLMSSVSDLCVSAAMASLAPAPKSGSQMSSIGGMLFRFAFVHDASEWSSISPMRPENAVNGFEVYNDAASYAKYRGFPPWMAAANMQLHKMPCGASSMSCMLAEDINHAVELWMSGNTSRERTNPFKDAEELAVEFGICVCACTRFHMMWPKEDSSDGRKTQPPWLVELGKTTTTTTTEPSTKNRTNGGSRDVISIVAPRFIPDSRYPGQSPIPVWVNVLAKGFVNFLRRIERITASESTATSGCDSIIRCCAVAMLGSDAGNGMYWWDEIAKRAICTGRWIGWLIETYTSVSWSNVQLLAGCMSKGELLPCASAIVAWMRSQCGWASVAGLLKIPDDVLNVRGKSIMALRRDTTNSRKATKNSSGGGLKGVTVLAQPPFPPNQMSDTTTTTTDNNGGSDQQLLPIASGLFGGITSSITNMLRQARNAPTAERLRSIDGKEGAIPMWMDELFRGTSQMALATNGMPKYDVEREHSPADLRPKIFVMSNSAAIRCGEVLGLISTNHKAVIAILDELGDILKPGISSSEQDRAFSISTVYNLSAFHCTYLEVSKKKTLTSEDAVENPHIGAAIKVISEITKAYIGEEGESSSANHAGGLITNSRGGLARLLLIGLRNKVRYTNSGGSFIDNNTLQLCTYATHACQHEGEWISAMCGNFASAVAREFLNSSPGGKQQITTAKQTTTISSSSSSSGSGSLELREELAGEMEIVCLFASGSLHRCCDNKALSVIDSGFVSVADRAFPNDIKETRSMWATCIACATIARARSACMSMQKMMSTISDSLASKALDSLGSAFISANTLSTISMDGGVIARRSRDFALQVAISTATRQLCIAVNSLIEVSSVMFGTETRLRMQLQKSVPGILNRGLEETASSVETGHCDIQSITLMSDSTRATEVLRNIVTAVVTIVENGVVYGANTFSDRDKTTMAALVCSPAFSATYLLNQMGIMINGEVHEIAQNSRISNANAEFLFAGATKIIAAVSQDNGEVKKEMTSMISKWIDQQRQVMV